MKYLHYITSIAISGAIALTAIPAESQVTVVGGTTNGTISGTIQNWKVDSSGNGSVNVSNNGVAVGGSTASQNYALIGTNNSSAVLVPIIQADKSVPINISSTGATQLVSLVSGKAIYVTSWDVIAAGTGNITLEYGTGTNCGTGTAVLTGAYSLTAQTGIAKGNGMGPVLFVPAGNELCALASTSAQMSGSVSYTQF